MTRTKRIFITGSSSGLGKAAAQRFAHEGWHVIASMRRPSEETELTKVEGIELMALDVSDPAAITEAAARTLKDYGPVDVLFNNAGYGLAGPLEASEDDQLVRQIDTNLLGVMRLTKAFVPSMRERRTGTIVTTTSIGAHLGMPFTSAYHATKWALEGWSESLWYELKSVGVRIKTVAPGGITTDFAGRSLDQAMHPAYEKQLASVWQAVGKRQAKSSTAEQIADVVFEAATDASDRLRYLAGDDAKMMHSDRLLRGPEKYMEASYDEYFAAFAQGE